MTIKGAFRGLMDNMPFRFVSELKRAVSGCESILDVGCGSSSPIKSFSKGFYCVGVDLFEPSIEESRKQGIHNEYHRMDVLDIDKHFKEKSFDCVMAIDLIEHLEKEDGIRLLEKMERLAKKRVIIFTPNGFLPQGEHYGNPLQIHRSGWTVEEMKGYGYRSVGISGWKSLRKEGEPASLKKRIMDGAASLSTPVARYMPSHAFQILCIKDL